MDEQAGQFYVQPEEDEVREINGIQQANPIYTKPVSHEPNNIQLKMVEITREIQPSFYKPFKIQLKHGDSDDDSDSNQQYFSCNSPFTEFYSKEQLVYQRYDNAKFNKFKDVPYYPGSFLPKNLFFDYMKEDSQSLIDIIKEFYEIDNQNLPIPSFGDLIFDSNFESGNLFAAFKISDRQYDLVMQNDNNSCGNNQWFYFSIQKLVPGAQYTFNVVNFTKSDSLFNYGMTPVAYSNILHKKNGLQWFHVGKDISYKKSAIPRQNSKKFYYKLTIKLTWKIANDKIYLAYTFPYSYSKLCTKIESLLTKYQDILTKVNIGKTLAKKNIIALTICNKLKSKKDNRKAIIIMARQHPGQTQGSHVCQGVIQKLLSKQSKQSEILRKNFIFYVIPMVNPDGVIFGHYRTNLAGKDLNRKWDSTDKQLCCPEVVAIKSYIQQISKQRQIRFILDLHGHSKKLNSFFYGNPCPDNPQLVRVYPYICSRNHPAVEFMDCTFATQQYKRKAARVYLSYIYKQIHVYTYQVSFHAYFKEGAKVLFNPKQFALLGQNLINCLHIMLQPDIKTQGKTNSKESLLAKYMIELKQNKRLLEVGSLNQSGSQSHPQEGQINMNQVPEAQLSSKKSVAQIIEEDPKSIKKPSSRKNNREIKQIKQPIKPARNIRFLEMSRVNSVLPDKYQLGLQPIRKKQSLEQPQIARNQSIVMKINSHCQTDSKQDQFMSYTTQDIQECGNLSSSVRVERKKQSQKRYSSLIKNSKNNNNIIFKIDFNNDKSPTTVSSLKEAKIYYHAFSQTIISYQKYKSQRIKSSQLFPLVDSPDTDRKIVKNQIKFQTMKIGLKRQTQIFLNGMVKKFLVEKQLRTKQVQPGIGERPLSIKRKQIYRKL